jgi:hypothetical protein
VCWATTRASRNLWVQSILRALSYRPYSPCLSTGAAHCVCVCVYVCVVIFCVTSLCSILYDVCYMTFLCLSLNVCGVWCVASSSTPFTEHGTWTKIPPSILPPICVLSERTLNKQQFALVVSLTRILLRKVIKMRTDELGKRRESNVCNCLTRSYIMLHNSVLCQRSIHLFSNCPLH